MLESIIHFHNLAGIYSNAQKLRGGAVFQTGEESHWRQLNHTLLPDGAAELARDLVLVEHVVHTTRSYVLKGIDPKLAGPFLLLAPVGWINFAFLLFEHTWLFPGSTVGLAKLQIDTAFPPGYWIQVG